MDKNVSDFVRDGDYFQSFLQKGGYLISSMEKRREEEEESGLESKRAS